MKRILTIQDISCLGKCSSTIALPILSAMGIETVLLPTALLSTHTGFRGNTFLDLTDEIMKIADHWKREGMCFDAIYTGYLGTVEDIEIVKEVVRMFSEVPEKTAAAADASIGAAAYAKDERCDGIKIGSGPFLFVDPVMGDHGKLYRGFTDSYVEANRSLCAMADMIVPNLTEACLLTGTPYTESPDREFYERLLEKLTGSGFRTTYESEKRKNLSGRRSIAAVTGASLQEGMTGIVGIEEGRHFEYQTLRVPYSYHGTGDLFASAAIGGILRGLSSEEALRISCEYTAGTIKVTAADPTRTGDGERYGILFEDTLPELMNVLNEALRIHGK